MRVLARGGVPMCVCGPRTRFFPGTGAAALVRLLSASAGDQTPGDDWTRWSDANASGGCRPLLDIIGRAVLCLRLGGCGSGLASAAALLVATASPAGGAS